MQDLFGLPSVPFPSQGFLLGGRAANVAITTEAVYLECPMPGGLLLPGNTPFKIYNNFKGVAFAGAGTSEAPYLLVIYVSGSESNTASAALLKFYIGTTLVGTATLGVIAAAIPIATVCTLTGGPGWKTVNAEINIGGIVAVAGEVATTTLAVGLDITQNLTITGTTGDGTLNIWSARVYAVPLIDPERIGVLGLDVDGARS